jgi:hypothetical protein
MKAIMRCMAVALTLLTANLAFGQAAAPAGSTGVCKDGSFSTAASKSGRVGDTREYRRGTRMLARPRQPSPQQRLRQPSLL